jgi:hypothetical protein
MIITGVLFPTTLTGMTNTLNAKAILMTKEIVEVAGLMQPQMLSNTDSASNLKGKIILTCLPSI